MDKSDFIKLTNNLLYFIATTIESTDINGLYDVDFHNDIVSIKVTNDEFVINKHLASMQIWLSSPISGPYHFSYIHNQWIDNKKGINLLKLLTDELKINFF